MYQYIRGILPNVDIINAISKHSTTNSKDTTNEEQKVSDILYLRKFEPSITVNQEDIATEIIENTESISIPMFENHVKFKNDNKIFMTPQSVGRRTIRIVNQSLRNPKSIKQIESNLQVMNSRNDAMKGILFRLKHNAIVSCTTVLDNKLLTIINSEDGDSQVLKIMLYYAQRGDACVIHGSKYYPICLIKESDTITLYSKSLEDQNTWIVKINNVSSHYLLTDKYNVGSIIYKGINSTIREGTKVCNELKVALRIISKDKIKDYDQMKKQIDVLKMIKHDNIIKLYDIIESPTTITIVTEKLEGPNLQVCLTKNIDDAVIKSIIDCLASAIYTMKSYGVVHRGIQLKSIVFSKPDLASEPKIVNFSMLNLCRHDEYLGGFKGNLKYTAPEIILHKMCDYKADVWSLGVVFYALLSGKLPFDGDSASDVMNAIANTEPDFTKGRLMERNAEAIELAKKMLCKDVENRIAVEDILTNPYLCTNTHKRRVKSEDKMMLFKMYSRSFKKLPDQ